MPRDCSWPRSARPVSFSPSGPSPTKGVAVLLGLFHEHGRQPICFAGCQQVFFPIGMWREIFLKARAAWCYISKSDDPVPPREIEASFEMRETRRPSQRLDRPRLRGADLEAEEATRS